MDLLGLVRLTVGRIAILVVLAAAAAAGAAVLVHGRPAQYENQVVVFLDQALGVDSGESANSATTDFARRVSFADTVVAASRASDLPPSDFGDVSVSHASGDPSLVLRMITDAPDVATRGAPALATATLISRAQQGVTQVQTALNSAQAAVDAAQKSVDEFAATNGTPDLVVSLQQSSTTIAQLQAQVDAAPTAALRQQLAVATATYQRQLAQRPTYSRVVTRRDAGQMVVNNLYGQLVSAQTRLASASTPSVLLSGGAVLRSERSTTVRAGLAAAVVVIVFWFLLFALVDSRRRARAARPGQAAAEPAALDAAVGRIATQQVLTREQNSSDLAASEMPAHEPASWDTAVPEPALPEPALPEPALPEPALPEPALPEPALPEPALPEPARWDPLAPVQSMPEPVLPETPGEEARRPENLVSPSPEGELLRPGPSPTARGLHTRPPTTSSGMPSKRDVRLLRSLLGPGARQGRAGPPHP